MLAGGSVIVYLSLRWFTDLNEDSYFAVMAILIATSFGLLLLWTVIDIVISSKRKRLLNETKVFLQGDKASDGIALFEKAFERAIFYSTKISLAYSIGVLSYNSSDNIKAIKHLSFVVDGTLWWDKGESFYEALFLLWVCLVVENDSAGINKVKTHYIDLANKHRMPKKMQEGKLIGYLNILKDGNITGLETCDFLFNNDKFGAFFRKAKDL